MTNERKVSELGYEDQYNSLSREDKVRVRDEFMRITGLSYPSFYNKMKNGFRPIEEKVFIEILNNLSYAEH